jgi:hypothetical protein
MSPLTESTRLTLAKGQPVPNDPYLYTNTVLLLHGDGTNGSTNIVDSSKVAGSPKAVTAVGNAQISTAQSKFGGSSIAFDGTGDALTTPDNSAFDLGGSSFIAETWVYPTSNTGLRILYVKRTIPSPGIANIALAINAGVATFWASSGISSWDIIGGMTFGTPALNAWSHIAVVRNGSSFTGYLNGVGTSLGSSSGVISTTSSSVSIGGDADGSSSFAGYIDDLRITKGVARYTANFTPPTAPFPDF